jgi:hypothetical protein
MILAYILYLPFSLMTSSCQETNPNFLLDPSLSALRGTADDVLKKRKTAEAVLVLFALSKLATSWERHTVLSDDRTVSTLAGDSRRTSTGRCGRFGADIEDAGAVDATVTASRDSHWVYVFLVGDRSAECRHFSHTQTAGIRIAEQENTCLKRVDLGLVGRDLSLFTSTRETDQYHRGENTNDRDDDEELDQGETFDTYVLQFYVHIFY